MAATEVRRESSVRTSRGRFQETRLHLLAAAGLVTWQVGAHVDIWFHAHRGFEIDSFFTWSHALLYAGWLLSGLVVVGFQMRSRSRLPRGFRTYLWGVALFGVGGGIDLAWHSLFGFEVSQSAVLSPAHLWLSLALTVAAFGLLEATARWRGSNPPTTDGLRVDDIPLILSLGMLLRVTTWYGTYSDPLTIDFADGGAIASGLQGYAGVSWDGMTAQIAGTSGIFLRSILLTLFVVVPLRRFRLPSGSITLLLLYEALLIAPATGQWPSIIAVVGAAVAAEVIWAWTRRGGLGGPDERAGYWVLAATLPLVQSALGLAVLELFGGSVAWSVHLWAGVPLTAGLLGLSVSMLALPPAFLVTSSTER